MKTNNKGFSLVELIVVIAIMAILAAVAIPTFAGFITKAQTSNDEALLNDLQYAVNLAKVEYDMVDASKNNIENGALSVVIANNKITSVKLGETVIYTPASESSDANDPYKIGSVVDMTYTFKQVTGTVSPKGDGHWGTPNQDQ